MVPHVLNPRTQKAEVETGLALSKSKVSTIKFSQVIKLCQKSESPGTFSSVVIIT